jgi:hypothetical protein
MLILFLHPYQTLVYIAWFSFKYYLYMVNIVCFSVYYLFVIDEFIWNV